MILTFLYISSEICIFRFIDLKSNGEWFLKTMVVVEVDTNVTCHKVKTERQCLPRWLTGTWTIIKVWTFFFLILKEEQTWRTPVSSIWLIKTLCRCFPSRKRGLALPTLQRNESGFFFFQCEIWSHTLMRDLKYVTNQNECWSWMTR